MEAADINIELGSDPSGGCPCCDPDASFPQGYVMRGGQPHALYFIDWDYGASGFVELMIAIGDFAEGSSPADRKAAAFHGRLVDGKANWTGFDAGMSLWRSLAMAGERLSVEDAAREPEFRTLADMITSRDPRIQKALAATLSKSTNTLRPAVQHGGTFAAQAAPSERDQGE